MSTEFCSTTTEEVLFVRWYAGPDRGACFEFGTVSNFEAVCEAVDGGETFYEAVPSTLEGPGRRASRLDVLSTRECLEELCAAGRVTFGEFPITVAMFSEEYFRFGLEF